MNNILKSYQDFKHILPHNHTPKINFDNYTKLLQESNIYEKKALELLKYFTNINISPKKFITFIIISNYPEVVADNPSVENTLIITKCTSFFNHLEQIENTTNIAKLLIKLNSELIDLIEIYNNWKNKDCNIKIQEFINGYYELELIYLNISVYSEDDQIGELTNQLKTQQNKLVEYIQKIGGNYGIQLLNSKRPVYINVEKFKEAATDAFWDTLKLSLEQLPRNYSRIILILKEIKHLFYALIPHRHDIHNELNEHIDTDLLLQMLENDAITFDEIFKIMTYIVELLQKLQAPSEDKNTLEWWNNIQNLIKPDNTYGKIMTDFFKGILERIENIQIQLNNINK